MRTTIPFSNLYTPARRSARLRYSVGGALGFAVCAMTATAPAAPPASTPAPAPAPAPAHVATESERTVAACLQSHRSSQELRKTGKLLAAARELLVCTRPACPGPVIADCGAWTMELQQATPSFVFEVTVDGRSTTDARVTVDGTQVTDWSHALNVDPGSHAVEVELAPFPPHRENILMAEGHRMRLVSVNFATPKPAEPAQAPSASAASGATPGEERRPTPKVVYPLLGLGVVGVAGFAVFGALGKAKQSSLETSCSPNCTSAETKAMKTNYLIGDVSLGVGIAALAGAAIVYLTRPSEPPRATFYVGPRGEGGERRAGWGASGWEASTTIVW